MYKNTITSENTPDSHKAVAMSKRSLSLVTI